MVTYTNVRVTNCDCCPDKLVMPLQPGGAVPEFPMGTEACRRKDLVWSEDGPRLRPGQPGASPLLSLCCHVFDASSWLNPGVFREKAREHDARGSFYSINSDG